MSYSAVMLLAKERPKLQFGNQFSGSAVVNDTPGMPPNQSLLLPSWRGIVVETGEAKKGHRGYYRLADPPGVERALRELGLL